MRGGHQSTEHHLDETRTKAGTSSLDPASLRARIGDIRIRPPGPSDALRLFPEIHARPAVTRWLCTPGPEDVAELRDQYTHWRRGTPDEPIYTLVVESSTPIGQVTFRFDGHPNVCDLGFWLGERHQNRGHGSALVRLAVALAFERMGAHAVIANVKAKNERSLAVLERTGFVRSRAPSGSEIAWTLSLSERSYRRENSKDTGEIEWE